MITRHASKEVVARMTDESRYHLTVSHITDWPTIRNWSAILRDMSEADRAMLTEAHCSWAAGRITAHAAVDAICRLKPHRFVCA